MKEVGAADPGFMAPVHAPTLERPFPGGGGQYATVLIAYITVYWML